MHTHAGGGIRSFRVRRAVPWRFVGVHKGANRRSQIFREEVFRATADSSTQRRQDGQVLCAVANAIQPGIIKKVRMCVQAGGFT